MSGMGLPPGYGQPPPHGMPDMGPPLGYDQPPPQGMPGMGPPPSYDQPPPKGMRGMGQPPSPIPGLKEAWVLVYNVGQENEGVFTQTQNGQSHTLVAFEEGRDADRFAHILSGEGFEPATPICWDADHLAGFTHQSGMDVMLVPRGELPPPPTTFDMNGMGGRHPGGDPERKYPGDGTMRPDVYSAQRPRLEELLGREPDNCGDDDCMLPVDEPLDAASTLRQEAVTAIDAVLAGHNSTMDLTMLMESAWKKAKAEKDQPKSEEGEEPQ
jgi:hypothetical protein